MDAKPTAGRPPKIHPIPLEEITLLPKSMRPRVTESAEQIERYRLDMERGDVFPPVVVYKGKAKELEEIGLDAWGQRDTILKETDWVYVLSDGYHRLAATIARHGGTKASSAEIEIPAIVKIADRWEDTWRDAQWFAFGANHQHGLPVTNADKRRIVNLILDNPEWARRAARTIAAHCHVSPGLVDQLKKERAAATPAKDRQSDTKVVITKTGHAMKTANIGKTKSVIGKTKLSPSDRRYEETRASVLEQQKKKEGDPRQPVVVDAIITPPSRVVVRSIELSGTTSEEWIESLRCVIGDARSALVGIAWNRFIGEARDLITKVTVDA